ncbi:Phage-related protein [Enterococcus malodoratus]|nr:Phage-related protein [Enterococcus malodoratus]
MAQGMGGFGRSMKMLWSQLFLFTFLYQGIMTLAGGLFKALQTNAQFSASLNQIKVNLLTAFYPIYQAALPAINALMSALAKVTGYIAGFISTLFGMNIGDAFNGAQGLMNNVQALDDTGSAASDASDGYDEMAQSIRDSNKQLKAQHDQTEAARKKVKEYKRLLAGFDELNILDFSNDSDEDFSDPFVPQEIPSKPKNPNAGGSKAPWADFGSATVPETPKWLTDFAKKFKDIMSQLFDPIKKAWDAQGQKVIDAWKYALREVVGLIQAIGKSFMEVWTNGTGQRFVENLLILLADVLSIIGDIAGAFKRAWEDNGRGTALIQSIFDMFNSILELLHQIAVSFRNAWNDGVGERIAANILEIFTNINNTISNLADRLSIAWQIGNIGESIFRRILGIIEGLLVNINNITKSTAEWAKKLDFTPLLQSIDGLLKSIQPLTKNIGAGLEWFYKNVLLPLAGFTIEKLIPAFFDALAGAIDLVNGIINGCKPAFDFLWNSILKPLAEWTGGVIVDVLKKIGEALSALGNWISEHSEGFSAFVTVFGTFASVLAGAKIASSIVGMIAPMMEWITLIKSGKDVLDLFSISIKGVVTALGGPWAIAIAAAIAVGVLLWQNWDVIKEKAGQLKDWIVGKWDAIKNATSTAWDNVKNWTSEKWEAAKNAVTSKANDIYNAARDKFTNTANTVRDKAGQAKEWVSTKWSDLKNATSSKFEEIRSTAGSKMNSAAEAVRSGAESAKSKAVSAFSSLKDGVGGHLNSIKTTASDVFKKVGGWASNLPGDIAKGLSSGLNTIKQAMNNIANGLASGIGKGVNGIISGVNWVMSSLGAGWRLSSWQVPYFSYASGTNSHPGGLAMVNDGDGSNWREMYKLPNGQVGMFPNQKDYMVNLPRGTQVLNGQDTNNFMSNIPHYKGGLIDSVKNFFGSISPSALLDRAFEKFVDVAGLPEPGASMALGAAKRIKSSAFRVVSDRISELFRLDRENDSKKKGFANGGRVDHFGWYKMSEGNNTEWVVPVTKPELAFQRINEALDFMGYDGIPDLTMPEVFRDSSDSYTGSSSSGKKNKGFSITGNGMENLSDNLLSSLGNTIANAIINALSNLDLKGNDGPLEVVLEVDSTRLGQVTVRGINQYHEQIGNVELNL